MSDKAKIDIELLNHIDDGVVLLDKSGSVLHLNDAAIQLLDSPNDTITDTSIDQLFQILPIANSDGLPQKWTDWSVRRYDKSLHVIKTASGKDIAVTLSLERKSDDQPVWLILRPINTTGEARITRRDSIDGLTGLFNRRAFEMYVNDLLNVDLSGNKGHVVFYIDVDQFSAVNASLGHEGGDKILRQIGTILKNCLRGSDVIARIGNDEFGVLLKNCPMDVGQRIAQNLVQAISDSPFSWNESQLNITITIGITAILRGKTFMQILGEAEAACKVAKTRLRNRIHVYSDSDDVIAKQTSDLRWIQMIKRALEEDRFSLYVQKILPLGIDDNEQSYNEVLVRMLDEQGNIVPPLQFIPVAERYGLMHDVDRWVIRTALKTLAEKYTENGKVHGKVAINLSGPSISDEETLSFIESMINTYPIDPSKLCFEITETSAIENIDQAKILIAGLKKHGCEFALDDFGSGMSSFGYLKYLNIDYIKIDGIFVKDMAKDPVDYKLVNAIHQLGKTMGMRTVAEFVENMEILQKLQELGIDYAQGYAIGKPAPISTLVH